MLEEDQKRLKYWRKKWLASSWLLLTMVLNKKADKMRYNEGKRDINIHLVQACSRYIKVQTRKLDGVTNWKRMILVECVCHAQL